jgi:hypothetical protein
VIISFGHEMNGTWYSWGWKRQSPADFVAAWQHIVTLFRQQGDYNVTWVWSISHSDHGTGPLMAYWPGSRYVTWVGVDGYFTKPGDTFASAFEGAIGRVRAVDPKVPVLLTEVAAGPSLRQPEQIDELFRAIRDKQLLGFIWFDAVANGTDWQIEDDPDAVAQFRAEAKRYSW